MSFRETLGNIHSDYRRYRATGEKGLLQVVLLTQGFWASLAYRLSHLVYIELHIPIIRQIMRFFSKIIQKVIEILTGISLPSRCRIGQGLYIGHFGQIIVHPETQIGDNCNLSQGVTIGLMSRGKYVGVPKIGDRVFVGPNAIIMGGITIGDDVAIGAGAVVFQPVPPLAVVGGNPARVISYKGSFEYIQFDGMENDSKRLAALEKRELIKNEVRNNDS